MSRIRYNARVKNDNSTRVDALYGKSIFEYKARVKNLRELHSAIIILEGCWQIFRIIRGHLSWMKRRSA